MKRKIFFRFMLFWIIPFILYWGIVEYLFLPYLQPAGIRARIKNDYIKTMIPKDEIDYLILGDSSAFYTINPARMGSKSYSAAQTGASIYLSKNTFKELNIKKINKGVIVIQTFVAPHYDEDIWKIFVPQKMMDLSDVLSVFCGEFNTSCETQKKYYWSGKYFWHRIHLNAYAASTISYGLSTQFSSNMNGFSEHIKRNLIANHGHYAAKRRYLGNNDFFAAYWKNFATRIDPPKSELSALKELAGLVKQYGVNLYLVQPQLYRAEKLVDLEKYNKSYKDFITSRNDLSIVYLGYDEFNHILSREHYRDLSHLNEGGANKITDALNSFLELKQSGNK